MYHGICIRVTKSFRPGPLEAEVAPGVTMCDRYVENGDLDPEDYLDNVHEDLRDLLASSRGVIVYQEQVMKITQILAGYTLGAADSFRRVIGKFLPSYKEVVNL